jgi:hypothetical protein
MLKALAVGICLSAFPAAALAQAVAESAIMHANGAALGAKIGSALDLGSKQIGSSIPAPVSVTHVRKTRPSRRGGRRRASAGRRVPGAATIGISSVQGNGLKCPAPTHPASTTAVNPGDNCGNVQSLKTTPAQDKSSITVSFTDNRP